MRQLRASTAPFSRDRGHSTVLGEEETVGRVRERFTGQVTTMMSVSGVNFAQTVLVL